MKRRNETESKKEKKKSSQIITMPYFVRVVYTTNFCAVPVLCMPVLCYGMHSRSHGKIRYDKREIKFDSFPGCIVIMTQLITTITGTAAAYPHSSCLSRNWLSIAWFLFFSLLFSSFSVLFHFNFFFHILLQIYSTRSKVYLRICSPFLLLSIEHTWCRSHSNEKTAFYFLIFSLSLFFHFPRFRVISMLSTLHIHTQHTQYVFNFMSHFQFGFVKAMPLKFVFCSSIFLVFFFHSFITVSLFPFLLSSFLNVFECRLCDPGNLIQIMID